MPKEMKIRRIKIDNKTICSLVSGVMCLLTIFAIAVSVRNDIFRDSMYMVRIVDLISLFFLTFLSGYLYFKDSRIGAMGHFTLFLFNLFVAVFFAALTGSVYSMPEHIRSIVVLSALSYFFSMTFFLTLWLYQKRFIEETVITRMVTVLISIGVIIYFIAIIVNIFKPVLFLVTDEGIYSEDIEDRISIFLDLFMLSDSIVGCYPVFKIEQNPEAFLYMLYLFPRTLFHDVPEPGHFKQVCPDVGAGDSCVYDADLPYLF